MNEAIIIDANGVSTDKDLTDQQKIEWFKIRTAKITTNNSWSVSHPGGLIKDIWTTTHQDTLFLRDRLITYFFNLFEWKGLEPQFRQELERILFRFGKVAVVKIGNDFFPVQFTWDNDKRDFYGRPKEITITTDNEYNGTVYNNYGEDFIIMYNNYTKIPTLLLAWERIRQTMRSLIDVDNSSLLMRPKVFVGVDETDSKWVDLNESLMSEQAVIPAGQLQLGKDIEQLEGAGDNTIAFQDNYQFQLSNLLKMLGLKANMHNKAERMSELEVSRNDEFDNLLLKDMFDRRIEGIEDLKTLGMQGITLPYNEAIEGNEEKDEVNGELNKAKEEIDNEK